MMGAGNEAAKCVELRWCIRVEATGWCSERNCGCALVILGGGQVVVLELWLWFVRLIWLPFVVDPEIVKGRFERAREYRFQFFSFFFYITLNPLKEFAADLFLLSHRSYNFIEFTLIYLDKFSILIKLNEIGLSFTHLARRKEKR